MEKSPEAFRTISEVARELDVPQHVLRFWEGKFNQVKPMKRGGGRRYYRPQDIDLLRGIRHLLYGEGYTIRGVQKILRDQGIQHVITSSSADPISANAKPAPVSRDPAVVETAEVALNEQDIEKAASVAGLSGKQVRLLQATLYELTEIKKSLDETGE